MADQVSKVVVLRVVYGIVLVVLGAAVLTGRLGFQAGAAWVTVAYGALVTLSELAR